MIEIIPNMHPIFVHFTVALFSVAVGLSLLCAVMPDGDLRWQWQLVARWTLWFGMAATLLTLLSGINAYNSVEHDTPSHLAMTDHRNWALATIAMFLVATGVSIWEARRDRAGASPLLLVLLLIAAALLTSTAWRGGELVYRYGLGVMSLPGQSEHDHNDGHHAPVAEGEAGVAGDMSMDDMQLNGPVSSGSAEHDHASHPH